jgi:DNA-binding NarL/FixJ family response regulator
MMGVGSTAPGRAGLLVLTNKPVRGQRLVDGIAGLGLPYVVRLRAPATMGELDEAIHTHGARLILLDVDFASHLGPQALLQVSRGHPLVHWVLVWDALQVQDDKLLKCTGASGCLEWRSDAQTVMRCIAAVTAGDRPSDLEAAASDEAGESLTGREREALELVGQGLTNKHIALRLGISVNTVKKHLKQVFKKRGFNSRRQLFA